MSNVKALPSSARLIGLLSVMEARVHTCGTCYLRRDYIIYTISKPVGWQLFEFSISCTPIALVCPASTRLMGLLSTMEPRTYIGICVQ